jgi:transposase
MYVIPCCVGVTMTWRKPWEVSDELWAVIEPLLPKHERRFRYPGRKRIDDRKTLQGVLFVLYTGIQWEYLPQELGFGSGPTCWRRLAEWQEAGVWEELQRVLLDRLRAADRLDFSRVTVDASHVPAKRGRSSPKVGPSPVDRARPGSKHHVLTDAHGTPLRVSLTGGHRNDVTQLLPLVDGLPPVRGNEVGPGASPGHCMPTAGTTTTCTVVGCVSAASSRRSPGGASARLGPGPHPVGCRGRHRLAPRTAPPTDPLGNP